MTLKEIFQNPLTPVIFLHLVLRRSFIWGPSPYMYVSVTNMGSYFVLLSTLIALAEQKNIMEPYLTHFHPAVRYFLFCCVFLALLETAMLIIWAHTEIFLRDLCHFITSNISYTRSANPRLRMVIPELVVTAVGICVLILALNKTSTGHRMQRKMNALLNL